MTKSAKQYIQEVTSKGGRARAQKLSAKRRREIALKAVRARWAKARKAKAKAQKAEK
jgi:hypothetical protein